MALGTALVVGLTSVDASSYGGSMKHGIQGAEADADNISALLTSRGFNVRTLRTSEAIAQAVLDEITAQSKQLEAGDFFCFYFAGHGGQERDVSGDEPDGNDETLLLYDRPLIDDEFLPLWRQFRAGVRIVMISDSCHSGTNFMFIPEVFDLIGPIPPPILASADISAKLIHIGATRDPDVADATESGGVFTDRLMTVWNQGSFSGNYSDFFLAISALLRYQSPTFNTLGPVDAAFLSQIPFSI